MREMDWMRMLSDETREKILQELSHALGEEPTTVQESEFQPPAEVPDTASRAGTLLLADGRQIEGNYTIFDSGRSRAAATPSDGEISRVDGWLGSFGGEGERKVPIWDDLNASIVHVKENDKAFYLGYEREKPAFPYIDILMPTDPKEIQYYG